MNIEVDLIGVPFDLGGGQSGARYGPEGFVRSGIVDTLLRAGSVTHYVDLRAQNGNKEIFDTIHAPFGRVHYAHEVEAMARLVGTRTREVLCAGHLPVILGGDHSISIGSVGAALHPSILTGKKLGLVWIDAHLDAHTHRTTASHRAHGLPLATLLGHGPLGLCTCANAINYEVSGGVRRRIGTALSPLHVIHIGAGEDHCESEEYAFFEKWRIPKFSRKYLQVEGWELLWLSLRRIMESVDLLWVSLDLDALDRLIAPAVYYPNQNGLSREEMFAIAAVIHQSRKLCGVDLMEYNPQFERVDSAGRAITANTGIAFLLRLLGYTGSA